MKTKTDDLFDSQAKLDEKRRTDQLQQLMNTINQIESQEKSDLMSMLIDNTKLLEEQVSESS